MIEGGCINLEHSELERRGEELDIMTTIGARASDLLEEFLDRGVLLLLLDRTGDLDLLLERRWC